MSRSEARTRFAAALIARDFYEKQMRLIHNAEIHEDQAVSELGNRIKALAPDDVLQVLEGALADNTAVLDPITLKEVNARLDSGQLSLEMSRDQHSPVSEPPVHEIE